MLSIKNNAIKALWHGRLILIKHGPTIMMGVGVIGVVDATIMACKATLNLDEVLQETQVEIDRVHQGRSDHSEEVYSEQAYNEDLAKVYAQRVIALVKLYGPAILIEIVSIGSIIGAHHILSKRNVALAAAYTLVSSSFKDYRRRVVSEIGEEKEANIYADRKMTEITETMVVDGKKKKIKKMVVDSVQPSMYAQYFDENNRLWRRSFDQNLFFIRAQQNFANDMLKHRGYIFLNEVYESLGLPHTSAGQLVGWRDDGSTNSFVDFGVWSRDSGGLNPHIQEDMPIVLDFNVDGLIYQEL